MARFMLTHTHRPNECRTAFAAWQGFDSPLRRAGASGSCMLVDGNRAHRLWWTVYAPDLEAALAQLPPYIAERTDATEVKEVPIP